MDIQISLTKAQKRKLLKGHSVNLKHSQLMNGNVNVSLDKEHGRRLRRAMRTNKGFRLQPNQNMVQQMIEGEGFKDVMKKVNKGIKKAVSYTKKEIVPVVKNDVIPYAKEILKPAIKNAVKENRPAIDKALKRRREITEQKAEDLLMNLGVPKDLAQDLVTENSMKLSKKASKQLDKLEGKVDEVMAQDLGMVKGRDYAYLNPYDVDPDGLNLPVAVAEAIPTMKGEGVYRAVYLKGKGVPKFLKKIGKVLGKVVKSKPVKKILTQLAQQGVANVVSGITQSPAVGQMVGQATSGLVEKGVGELADTSGEAIGGAVLTMSGKTVMKKGKGGALYIPQGRGMNISKLQGGKYLL
jgi:hypothetical protein